ncbi:Probable phospholipid-transporting ATPase VD [Eumeta japonica]|uniref:Phospholipid-transporting ATPase n=1 Tax=Eumeta variegata TaxID=151549 RepID=A0A4C1SY03_EUMVA|nr:Probable phospholipid-transporting ATPase VD [Eumeta japonica]
MRLPRRCGLQLRSLDRYVSIKWRDVRVGDFVHLSNNEAVPADMVLLHSANPNGVCYLDTCNLDGETNLKQRIVAPGFREKLSSLSCSDASHSEVEDGILSKTDEEYEIQAVSDPEEDDMPLANFYFGRNGHYWRKQPLINTRTKTEIRNLVWRLPGPKKTVDLGKYLKIFSFKLIEPHIRRRLGTKNLPVPLRASMLVILGLSELMPIFQAPSASRNRCSILPRGKGRKGRDRCHKMFTPRKFMSKVEVERPSTKIYRFTGVISHPDGARVPLTSDNLLLRECFIKNTDYVEGIVVYAGHETKAMLNNGGPRYKCSKLERRMNTDVIWCVLVLLFLCCAGAVGCKLWFDNYSFLTQLPPFIPYAQIPAYEGLLIFWTFIIVLQVMIPVSLYVTIEMTKLLQVYHIHQDVEMYDPETNTRVECRALNITEELGQINYLFSDKTGTLTENKMVFRRCTVNGVDYDHPPGPPAEPNPHLPPLVTPLTHVSPNRRLLQHLTDTNDGQHTQKVREFLLVLTVCNTVVVSQPHVDVMQASGSHNAISMHESGPQRANGTLRTADKYSRLAESRSTTPSPPPSASPLRLRIPRISFGIRDDTTNGSTTPVESQIIRFEAESPDELALAEAALAYGYELRNRDPDAVELGIRGELSQIVVLRVQEFDATRKCMSIAIQTDPNQVILYVKGADTTLFNALEPMRNGSPEAAAYERTRSLISEYSRAGLRTLVMAKRTLTVRQWEDWLGSHVRASEIGEGRERRIRESLNRLESGLTLLGATGVEDRLQEAVPQTVRALLDAGIVVWVLTGDKPETAINIAYSAALFSQGDKLLQLMSYNKEQAESTIKNYLERLMSESAGGAGVAGGRALVVDGRTLTYILDKRSGLVAPFLSLARRCSAVLCCRATPLQKAYIVKAVKEELGVTTLAIGDGANDVSMIQTADVGVGLSGQEGRQAVMASDFALSRFKYIERLLLVHGHWCYDRLARMILYFFLKNATFVFLLFWYQLYCGFSSSVMIDQLHLMTYNLIFTAIPPLIIGAYDRIAPAALLLERPGLYAASRRGLSYRAYSYWTVLAECIYISIIVFFISLGAYWDSDVDIWEFGTCSMTSCLVVMLAYVAIETRSWTVIHIFALLGSLGAYFALTLVYQSLCVTCFNLPSTFHVMHQAIGDPRYWLVVILTTCAALVPRMAAHALRNSLWPGALGRAVLARRRSPRTCLPYAAHYHTTTASAQVYRSTDENGLQNGSEMTAIT